MTERPRPGAYRHFKGEVYIVEDVEMIDATTDTPVVMYRPRTFDARRKQVFTRTYADFNALEPNPGGKGTVPRFKLLVPRTV